MGFKECRNDLKDRYEGRSVIVSEPKKEPFSFLRIVSFLAKLIAVFFFIGIILVVVIYQPLVASSVALVISLNSFCND